jgi:nucleoside-diphosphate-sugar epimerase
MVYGDGGGLVHGLLTSKAAERGTGVYIGPPGTRWPVVHIDDLAALYLAVATRAAPATIWHGASETIRLDAIATALGGGTAASWPVAKASANSACSPTCSPGPGRLCRQDPRRSGLGTRPHLNHQIPHRLTGRTATAYRAGNAIMQH